VLIASGETASRVDVHSPGVLPGTDAQPQACVGAYSISRTKGADLVCTLRWAADRPSSSPSSVRRPGKPALVNRPPALNANYPAV
jgi:hypothetical protein